MPTLITNKNLGFTKQKCNCGIISNSIEGFQKTKNKSTKNKSTKNKNNKTKLKKK